MEDQINETFGLVNIKMGKHLMVVKVFKQHIFHIIEYIK